MSLSTLASEQSKATTKKITNIHQLLDYLGTHPEATIKYYTLNMILNVHSYASYLSARDASIRPAGNLFLGWTPQDKHPAHLNGAIFTLFNILKFVTASEEEAELGTLFLNSK